MRNGRLGTVAILKPMHGAALPTLAAALASAGFGVTQVGWDDLAAKRLPDSKLDLLVLSDARALPVQARDQVDRLLCSGGRVIAIGAPAGSRLFARTPDGWVDQVGWMEATARRIERTPLPIADGAWARTAYRETQRASITRDPTQGADCWKMTTDLAGWDGWLAHAPGAFGDDRSLMVIEAKGDAQTTHLAVECVEKDSSRWFGVIPLTTEWKTHILRPEDFAYWLDSSATGRGGAGDRFRPGNVARISFTLSASHTPKVKPGPHTYWIRGLSTAGETGERPPSFALTDVEALWPSYKLYPMNEIATLRAAGEQGIVPGGFRAQWTKPGYSPVWRERGRGVGRGRAWRWVPILEAFDRAGRKRGALLSLTIGDGSSPNAMWANLAVADPKDAAKTPLLTSLVATAKAMVRGTCLLEGGAEQFAYKPGEPVRLGARALNSGRKANTVEVF
ncbi:MAG: hypothetical protein FJX72_18555, partial [Armatimonadetes bacterium]|nr:hypothetical protein [Armatimonadota bacterium]